MSASRGRYTALQTSREDEMEAAFESDDEGSDNDDVSRPMLPARSTTPPPPPSHTRAQSVTAGGYNFERVFDYDVPPPGSPPRLSERALPTNTIGNSNGVLSDAPAWRPAPNFLQQGLRTLFPSRYARVPTSEPVGGGRGNDGVFANVVAKPTRARVETTPDGVHVMPEEAQKDMPPSYSAAQADSVPPYWETTVHAPSASVQGEMIVDNLPTGTLFSFLWNMLISLSFNFVGFLLTYLLHTTHAAKYGSRAGLGITLLQYGFALRGREDGTTGSDADTWPWVDLPDPESAPEPTTSGIPNAGNNTATAPDPGGMDSAAPYTQEWVAFFLMTIGWFLVLTSFLGYWRVKRWEHSILVANAAAAASAPAPTTTAAPPTISVAQQIARDRAISRNLEVLFGLSRHMRNNDSVGRERDLESGRESTETNMTPEERRLRTDLRAAGLI